ncbi:MAG TPA: cytochrome c biogenesis protein ResB [Rhodocyclaceae bacterium]
MKRSFARNLYELLSSMRFAISLLTLLAIASIIGTVLKQNEPYNNYLNQFGPFWFGLFEKLGLYGVYHASWFLAVLTFLVASTSLCIFRQGPQMLKEMRSFREHAQESSLRMFAHQASLGTTLPRDAAQQKTAAYLQSQGYRLRAAARPDGVLLAAKAGSWNRLGYLLAHTAIVTICIGGLADGDLPLKAQLLLGDKHVVSGSPAIADIPAESRLPASHWSYRGNIFLPEGRRSGNAILNISDGVLLQELPFNLTLKKFYVDYYSTGAPKRFASDVVIEDRASGERLERTIEVNKPFEYKGVTLYQASFEDGGTTLHLKAHSLTAGSNEVLPVDGVVGDAVKLMRRSEPLTLEVINFRPINVENLGTAEASAGTIENIGKHLGSAAKSGEKKDLHNVGPSMIFKLRDAAGQAREFHSYMQPILQEGRPFYMAGMREANAENFRYMRIPAFEGKLDAWFALRAVLTDPAARPAIARRFTATALKGDAVAETMRSKLAATAEQTLGLFAAGGYEALDQFIRKNVPQAEQEKAAGVFFKVLQGVAWDAWQLARERQQLKPLELTQENAAFVNDALNAVSDSFHYGAPVFLELNGFDEVKASVIQATRSPGKFIVYLGCALLIAGVCFMLYVHERRLFVLLKDGGEVLLAGSANRKTMAIDAEFARHSARIEQLLKEPDRGTGPSSH